MDRPVKIGCILRSAFFDGLLVEIDLPVVFFRDKSHGDLRGDAVDHQQEAGCIPAGVRA